MKDMKLTYFGIRGLAEPIRMLMIDNGIHFTDHQVTSDEWAKIKPTMQFGQVPCLHEGDMQLVQSGAIMRHLARKHGLYGHSETDMAYADMMYDGVTDLRTKYAKLIYQEYDMPGKREEFVSTILPPELLKFEQLLKTKHQGKGYLLGEKICYADYALFEIVDALTTLHPAALKDYPTLEAYQHRMMERPKLREYLHSDVRRNLKINGNGKQ